MLSPDAMKSLSDKQDAHRDDGKRFGSSYQVKDRMTLPLLQTLKEFIHLDTSFEADRFAALVPRRSCAGSLWFLFAELLEARIVPERIEHRIEPEQRGSERHVFVECACARY